jgi:hypothetical protein
MIDQLQPHRGFSRAFRAEHDGGRGLLGIADDFAPRRVKRSRDAEIAEDRIGLCVFVHERVAHQLMVLEKLKLGHDGIS